MHYKNLFNRLSSLDKIITTGSVMITSQDSSFLKILFWLLHRYAQMLAQNICNTHTKRHTPCTHIQTHTIYIYIYVHTLNHTTHVCIPYMLTPHTYTPLDTHTHTHEPYTNSLTCTHAHLYTTHKYTITHSKFQYKSNIHTLHIHIYHIHAFLRDIFKLLCIIENDCISLIRPI